MRATSQTGMGMSRKRIPDGCPSWKLKQETGGWKLEAGYRIPHLETEARNWRLQLETEVRNWRLEAGNWKLEAGNWKLETRKLAKCTTGTP